MGSFALLDVLLEILFGRVLLWWVPFQWSYTNALSEQKFW